MLTEGILETSVRPGGWWIRAWAAGLLDRHCRRRGGTANSAAAGQVPGQLCGLWGSCLHGGPDRVLRVAPAGRSRPDGAGADLPAVSERRVPPSGAARRLPPAGEVTVRPHPGLCAER